jgi:hypothetical protein
MDPIKRIDDFDSQEYEAIREHCILTASLIDILIEKGVFTESEFVEKRKVAEAIFDNEIENLRKDDGE